MTEQKKENRGGKRREGRTQTYFPVRIDNDLYAQIENIAQETGKKRGSIINILIRKALNL